MTKRNRLIWKTLILCSAPIVLTTVIIMAVRKTKDTPYVPGQEKEGITRTLERSLDQGLSGIRFSDVSEQAGVRFRHFPFRRTSQLPEDMGSGVAWGDYDGDGLPDLFLVNFAAPVGVSDEEMASSDATDRLFRNLGDGSFEDVTESAGVGAAHRGMGAAWADFDVDGDLDLFVTSWGENILWENEGDGTFRDRTAHAGLGGDGFWAGASWADFDLDGDLDLYVCGYVKYQPEEPGSPLTRTGEAEYPFTLNPSSYPPHPNRFYVNLGDGTFEERAAAAGVVGETGRSLAVAWADFDEDGWPDMYVSNDVSDNLMYRNRGDGTFENISYQALVADYRGSMGIAIGDWDGDLDLDLFVTHWIAQENALYSNLSSEVTHAEGGKQLFFGDDADRVGLGQIALDLIGWGTVFADLDNDGWLDLFVANGSTFQNREDPTQLIPMDPHLYWNRGAQKGFFEVGEEAGIRTEPPGGGRGVALADYDQDGDLDVAMIRHGGKARLLRNDSRTGHWVAFRLLAHSAHPSGLGARLVVHAGERSHLREAGSGPSYLSCNHSDVLVGLGTTAGIDSVEIKWPKGAREVWKNLEVDRLWRLEEGQEPQLIARSGVRTAEAGSGAGGRRTSGISEHAVVSDLTSQLTRDEKRRFWELNKKVALLFQDEKWSEAIDVFEQMIDLDPSHEDAVYYCGNCFLELGRFEEAKSCWERLIEINPASSRAWVQIGILHTMPEAGTIYDLQAAIEAFQKAHSINREESRPLVLWGEASLAQGDLESASEVLTSAYRMNSQETAALYLSGYIAWKQRDTARAGELLEKALNSFEREKPVRGVLGEGATRSDQMERMRRKAAARRLFSTSLETLREAGMTVDLNDAYSWVDQDRARLPATTAVQ